MPTNPSPFRSGRRWMPLEQEQPAIHTLPTSSHPLSLHSLHRRIFFPPNPAFCCPHIPLYFALRQKNSAATFVMIHWQAPTSQLHLEQESGLRCSKNFFLHWGLIFSPQTVCIIFSLCFPVQMSNSFLQPRCRLPTCPNKTPRKLDYVDSLRENC